LLIGIGVKLGFLS